MRSLRCERGCLVAPHSPGGFIHPRTHQQGPWALQLAAAAEDVAEAHAIVLAVEEGVLASAALLVAGSERSLVVHGLAQRREEGVVVEHLRLDCLAAGGIARSGRRGGRGRSLLLERACLRGCGARAGQRR